MKLQKTNFTIHIALLACLLIPTMALAQSDNAMVGAWNATAETDERNLKYKLVLKESDGKLGGYISNDGGKFVCSHGPC